MKDKRGLREDERIPIFQVVLGPNTDAVTDLGYHMYSREENKNGVVRNAYPYEARPQGGGDIFCLSGSALKGISGVPAKEVFKTAGARRLEGAGGNPGTRK